MAGSVSVPNAFAGQLGSVPASQLDANWTALTTYINPREISSGTLAARPTTPVSGTWYFARDDNGGTLYFSAATGWVKAALGLSGSATLTAPLTLTDVTAGGSTHPFLQFQKTGSGTWTTYWQKPANFATSETLTVATSPASGLQLHLVADPGGQRVLVWDPSNPLPVIPHTGIMPTVAVFGDVLIGDIVALASNPMTYFIRANADLPVSAITQFFSAKKAAGVEPDGGAQLILAPFKNGGGAVDDGFVQVVAYGAGTGGSANEIQFRHRSVSNTVVTTWHIGGGSEAPFYPQTDATLDLGTPGNRVRAGYFSSNLFVAGQQLPKGRLSFTNAGTVGATLFWGPWAADATEITAYVQHLMPFGGVLRNFFCKLTTAPGAGNDYKFTVRVNATSTTVVATISGAATTATNQANSGTFNRGDFVTLQVTRSGGAADITGTAALELDPS